MLKLKKLPILLAQSSPILNKVRSKRERKFYICFSISLETKRRLKIGQKNNLKAVVMETIFDQANGSLQINHFGLLLFLRKNREHYSKYI